jgi:hypothetical protein
MSEASALKAPSVAQGLRSQLWVRASTSVAAVAYAACLLRLSGPARILALFVMLDVAAGLLLWRVDCRLRSLRGRLVEDSGYLAVFVATFAALAISSPAWALRPGHAYWYVVALIAGLMLVRLSGMRIGSLLSGELAFLAGPKAWAPAILNCSVMTSAVVAEEALYRGGVLGNAGLPIVLVGLFGALTFCGKHHLPGWATSRWNRRVLGVEVASAVVFLALVVGSHSLYPAVLAHFVNNLPSIILQVQRARSADEETLEF